MTTLKTLSMSATNINKKFTIKKIAGINTLHINGKIANCCYRMPVMLPHLTIQGQIEIHNPICGDNCQFFNLYPERPIRIPDASGNIFGSLPLYNLILECNKTTFNVELDQSEPEAPKSNLMSL